MKDDRKDIKEPYPAEHTPNPPQIIDPSVRKERDQNDQPVENKQRQPAQNPGKEKKKEKSKLLGESETEINDETTI